MRNALLFVSLALAACGGAANNDLFSGGASNSSSSSSSSGGGGSGGGGGGGSTEPGDPGCQTTQFFRDKDDDGYGDPKQALSACTSPGKGWVTQAGDCNDEEKDVHPGQTDYFGDPYEVETAGGQKRLSFDYNCSGNEEQEPPPRIAIAGECTLGPVGLQCTGSGYIPARPRTGAGIDVLCGSKQYKRCQVAATTDPTTCVAQIEDVEPAPCR